LENNVLFQDRAGAARLTRSSLLPLTFGVHFADLDNDGYLDLLTANGHIEPEINSVQQNITFEQKPQVFYNDRQGKFVDISDNAGKPFGEAIVGRSIVTADIDQDGDLDVLITVNNGSPKLLRNDSQKDNNHILIKLKGIKPNLQAIGAVVQLWSGGIKQQRMVRTGSSYLSQSDIGSIIFGIGKQVQADSVVVLWPSSGVQAILTNIMAGETRTLEQ